MLAVVQVLGRYSQTAPKAWAQLFEWLDKTKPEPQPDHGYGLSIGDPRKVAENELCYVAGVVVPPNWTQCETNLVTGMRFDGGTFLRHRLVGPYTEVGSTISRLRDQWIPKNGLVLDQKQPVLTVYRSNSNEVPPAEQIADICLPVFADRRKEPRE